jgi:cell division septal protein FtsQ
MNVVYLDQQQLKRKHRFFYFKFFLIIFGIVALAAVLLYLVIYSPIFQVDKFIVENNKRISDEQVLAFINPKIMNNVMAKFLGKNNFLTWSEGAIDVSNTPLLTAKVDKDWLNRSIKISVQERELFGIWCIQNGVCYWLDQNGLAFEEAPETEGSLILKIYDKDKTETLLGSKIIEDRFLKNLLALLVNLKKMDLPIKKIVFDRKLQELLIEMYEGPDLMFSIRFDPALMFNSLQSLLKSLDLKKINYIDLRVENRMYYKNK